LHCSFTKPVTSFAIFLNFFGVNDLSFNYLAELLSLPRTSKN
jgi:hypothetical protein